MESFAFEQGRRILVREDLEAPFRRLRLLSEVSIDGVPHWQVVPLAPAGDAAGFGAVVTSRPSLELAHGLTLGLVEFDDERDEDTRD